MIHKTTSLGPHGAANSHNLCAIVERPVGLAAIQRGGSLASLECATAKLLDYVFSLRSNLPRGKAMIPPLFGGVIESKINTPFHHRPNSRNKPVVRLAARPGAGGRRYRASRSRYPNLAKGPRRPGSWPVVPRPGAGRGDNLRGLGTGPARRRRPGYSPHRERRRRSGRSL